MPETPFTPAELALEQTGLEFLRSGKFRKARDAFKSLNKSQSARALPLLIEANLGLANEMISKGMVSEADQVMAYLKTIAPPSYDLSLSATSPKANSGSDAWSAMVPLAAQRLESFTDPAEGIRAADEIILGATSPDHADHADAKAILTALEIGYGSANSAQTPELLRTVPRASPFSHWVFFFKGMTALEAGDRARAADCFRRVPESSLLTPSIPALLTICGEPAAASPAPRTVHALCAWAGHPKIAAPLLQVEPLWRKQQYSKAFTLLAKKVPKLFRWGTRDFKADLTRFLTTRLVHSLAHEYDYPEALLSYAMKSRTAASVAVAPAFFGLKLDDFAQCAHKHFQSVLTNLETMANGVSLSPAMRSQIFTRFGEMYLTAIKKNPGDPCNPPNAKLALEEAIKQDPGNLRAWLMLCDLLAMGKDTPAYNRFLDDLTKRFPNQKEVLIRNGDCCNSRKTYTKALRNFKNAAEIDSVDPRIRRGIVRAQLGIAENAYKKGNFSKVDWDSIESFAAPGMACRETSVWRLRVRRIILDACYGGATEESLSALAADTLPLAPSEFLLKTACRFGIIPYKKSFSAEILKQLFPSNPAPESLADFLAVLDELHAQEGGSRSDNALALALEISESYREQLLQAVANRKDLNTLLIKCFSGSEPNLWFASPVIEKFFKNDPTDRLLRFVCTSYSFSWLAVIPEENRLDLAIELRDSSDPDERQLFMLVEKNMRGVMFPNGKEPKLDLDYDPHEYGDDCDDEDDYYYDDTDEADLVAGLGALEAAIGEMSENELSKAVEELLGEISPGRENPFDSSSIGLPKPKAQSKPKAAPADLQQTFFDSDLF